MAGLSSVPVLVRNVPDTAALAMALIENIQREDLNPRAGQWDSAPDH
jgi:ParB family chromosome partitioning protein